MWCEEGFGKYLAHWREDYSIHSSTDSHSILSFAMNQLDYDHVSLPEKRVHSLIYFHMEISPETW